VLIDLLLSLPEVEKQSILSPKVLAFLNHLCVMLGKIHAPAIPFGGLYTLEREKERERERKKEREREKERKRERERKKERERAGVKVLPGAAASPVL